MAIIRWSPFRDIADMQDQMNKLFEDFLGRRATGEGIWSPYVDISETEDDIRVKAELPGVKKDDISISVSDNNILTLKGEKKREEEVKEENYYRVERSYGSFNRKVELPSEVKADEVDATYEDGILTISLPKKEEVKPKEIEIKVKSSSDKSKKKKKGD